MNKYFTAFMGCDGIVWLSEDYQLQPQDSDSDRDRYFGDKDRKEFIQHSDTFRVEKGKRKFYIKCMFDSSQEIAEKIIQKHIENKTRKVRFDDEKSTIN